MEAHNHEGMLGYELFFRSFGVVLYEAEMRLAVRRTLDEFHIGRAQNLGLGFIFLDANFQKISGPSNPSQASSFNQNLPSSL